LTRPTPPVMSPRLRPHRLVAQDAGLSRRKQGFDSPWGRHKTAKNKIDFTTLQLFTTFR
jgi:hypothetical protein